MLYLGDEQYASEGKKLKEAQQLAADAALKTTKYIHPPVKLRESPRTLTPTVLLNNLAAKLGLSVSYMLVTDNILVHSLYTVMSQSNKGPFLGLGWSK